MKKESMMGKPGAPYAKAVKAGGFFYLSGVCSVGPEGIVKGDIKTQTRQCLDNLKANLESVGSCMEDVVKVNIYLTNIKDFSGMNEVYREFFVENVPARTTVGVSELSSPDFIVEIDLVSVA